MIEKAQCKSCRADIMFLTKKASFNKPEIKVMPIDYYPSPDGNIIVDLDKKTYSIVKKAELDKARRLNLTLYKAHWATCKAADKFRKKK